jgi:hypothetical protein
MNGTSQSVIEIFSQLSPADETALISLPYRVGLYVSYADVTGGWDAQESELQSLTVILQEFSEDFYRTEFAQKVLLESLHARQQWPAWSKDIGLVPSECARMMALLESNFFPEELALFKDVLMDIAIAVAMAFREEAGQGSNEPPKKPALRELLSRLARAMSEKEPLSHINVSESERKAILALARHIGYTRL